MPMSLKEYSILPQGDEFHHHVRDNGQGTTTNFICLVIGVALLILLILAGVVALTFSVFFSDGIKTPFGNLFVEKESGHMAAVANQNDSFITTIISPLTSSTLSTRTTGAATVPGEHKGETEGKEISDESNSGENLVKTDILSNDSIKTSVLEDTESSNGSVVDNEKVIDESDTTNSTEIDTFTASKPFLEYLKAWAMSVTQQGNNNITMEEMKEKFAEYMRLLEKDMEDAIGIRRAEFVVPIFMLICFLSFFALVSICCCFWMRRRENRRKKYYGKLITDLQTGDSKTVLLNHCDMDD